MCFHLFCFRIVWYTHNWLWPQQCWLFFSLCFLQPNTRWLNSFHEFCVEFNHKRRLYYNLQFIFLTFTWFCACYIACDCSIIYIQALFHCFSCDFFLLYCKHLDIHGSLFAIWFVCPVFLYVDTDLLQIEIIYNYGQEEAELK